MYLCSIKLTAFTDSEIFDYCQKIQLLSFKHIIIIVYLFFVFNCMHVVPALNDRTFVFIRCAQSALTTTAALVTLFLSQTHPLSTHIVHIHRLNSHMVHIHKLNSHMVHIHRLNSHMVHIHKLNSHMVHIHKLSSHMVHIHRLNTHSYGAHTQA